MAQQGHQYAIKNSTDFDKVVLRLNANSGICKVAPSPNDDIINIHNITDDSQSDTDLESQIVNRVQHVNFYVKENNSESIGKAISNKILNSFNKQEDHRWQIFLSKHKPFQLDFNYVVGDATVDLSGIPIEKLNINTGNSNVNIGYFDEISNPMVMDSFNVKVDFGTLKVDQINLANANHIIADVGFGSLYLDFRKDCQQKSAVKATVGAGKLDIKIPSEKTPIAIYLNNSPLCKVKIPSSFVKQNKNTYVNQSYLEETQQNPLVFDVEVAMGNIKFHYQE